MDNIVELRLWCSKLHVVRFLTFLFERLVPLGLMPVANALGAGARNKHFIGAEALGL